MPRAATMNHIENFRPFSRREDKYKILILQERGEYTQVFIETLLLNLIHPAVN